jgi:hypothetical protein
VFGPINPVGAMATSFKKPTSHEALDLTYPSEMPGLDKIRID